jgi:hypothetical protein
MLPRQQVESLLPLVFPEPFSHLLPPPLDVRTVVSPKLCRTSRSWSSSKLRIYKIHLIPPKLIVFLPSFSYTIALYYVTPRLTCGSQFCLFVVKMSRFLTTSGVFNFDEEDLTTPAPIDPCKSTRLPPQRN